MIQSISQAMGICFKMGIKVYPIIKNGQQYVQVLLPDKSKITEDRPMSGEALNKAMTEKYFEYAEKFKE